jgi:hypothetical protein
MKLTKFESWSGDARDLVRSADEILVSRGLADASSGPNVGLFREHAQKGIVSRAERHGKDAVHGYRQLLEFFAARVLVAEGWPLAKIAEQFARIADAELRNLISGDKGSSRALAVVQRIRSETQLNFGARRSASYSLPCRSGELGRDKAAAESSDDFRDVLPDSVASRLSSGTTPRLGLPEEGLAVEQLTLLAVAPWCQILVESRRLSRLTIEEAVEIGQPLRPAC